MIKKVTTTYVCNNCGAESSRWSGKCFTCGEWNTLEEQVPVSVDEIRQTGKNLQPVSLRSGLSKDSKRLKTELQDVDTVLGGGLVEGSVNLIAGQPGIGKSTLLMQLAQAIGQAQKVLYVSAEESVHQVAMRAQRLEVQAKQLEIVSSSNTDDIATTILSGNYALVIVDSVQAIASATVRSSMGSVSQITNSTHVLTTAAKQTNTALMIVGHVTKEGSIAGPKMLEHLVDVVLQLEGDRYGAFKVLRAAKNRYGSTEEAAILEMKETGLVTVDNPSAALLKERQLTDGSVVLATLEGTRPLLVEVQALVNRSSFGYPKRAASGIDLNRVNLLVAMLERRTKLNLSEHDIYLNIVGGIRLNEPAADLAICMAIASAARGVELKKNAVIFGEVGLSGEVRHVPLIEKRVIEATKLGFVGAIGPKLDGKTPAKYLPVSTVREALNSFLSEK